jgi:hypothetical protein
MECCIQFILLFKIINLTFKNCTYINCGPLKLVFFFLLKEKERIPADLSCHAYCVCCTSSAVNGPNTRRTYLMIVSISFHLVSPVWNQVNPFCPFICNPMSSQSPPNHQLILTTNQIHRPFFNYKVATNWSRCLLLETCYMYN